MNYLWWFLFLVVLFLHFLEGNNQTKTISCLTNKCSNRISSPSLPSEVYHTWSLISSQSLIAFSTLWSFYGCNKWDTSQTRVGRDLCTEHSVIGDERRERRTKSNHFLEFFPNEISVSSSFIFSSIIPFSGQVINVINIFCDTYISSFYQSKRNPRDLQEEHHRIHPNLRLKRSKIEVRCWF